MSSIPNAAMPHAHVQHDEPEATVDQAEGNIARIVDTVKAHPRTGLAVGATLVLGAVAAAAIPALRAKPAPKTRAKTAAKRKTPTKRKPAAAKAA